MLGGVAGADVGVADAAAAGAVGEAAGAVEAVVAAAIAGDVAAGSRRDFLNCPSATTPRSERRIETFLLARAATSPLIVALALPHIVVCGDLTRPQARTAWLDRLCTTYEGR